MISRRENATRVSEKKHVGAFLSLSFLRTGSYFILNTIRNVENNLDFNYRNNNFITLKKYM